MSTQNQIAANRRNTQKSTGPRTAAGREAASWNAIKHGLTATSRVVLSEEERSEYERLATDLYDELRPEGVIERLALERLLQTTWRLKRASCIEASLLNAAGMQVRRRQLEELPRGAYEQHVLGRAFSNECDELEKLARYERHLERSVQEAQRELELLQYSRLCHVHPFCTRNLGKLSAHVKMSREEEERSPQPAFVIAETAAALPIPLPVDDGVGCAEGTTADVLGSGSHGNGTDLSSLRVA